MARILFNDKKECCGCEACANICPHSLINMVEDNEGFVYPEITDNEKCINCMQCEKVCPIKNIQKEENFIEKTFAGFSEKEEEIKKSASGGLGTAISKSFILNGGIVYGVQYSEDFKEVVFSRSETLDGIEKYRTSKYVQSRKYDIYANVENDLKDGKKVLFTCLPCEGNALRLYLKKDYPNLYICSLICHGPTSQKVHREYIDGFQEIQNGDIKEFSVRYKKDGWKPYYIRATFSDDIEYLEKFQDSDYGIAFIYMKRPSCNECKIKREAIKADITIGDYHIASKGNAKPYNRNGVSSAIVHTEKGMELINNLKDFNLEEVSLKNVFYSEAYYKAIPERENRQEFGKVFSEKGLYEATHLKSISKIERKIKTKKKILSFGAKIKRKLLGK